MIDDSKYVQAPEEVTNAESDFINGMIAFNIAELSLARAMGRAADILPEIFKAHRFLTALSDSLPPPGYIRGS